MRHSIIYLLIGVAFAMNGKQSNMIYENSPTLSSALSTPTKIAPTETTNVIMPNGNINDESICIPLKQEPVKDEVLGESVEFDSTGKYSPINSTLTFKDYTLFKIENLFNNYSINNEADGYDVTGNTLISLASNTGESNSIVAFVNMTISEDFTSDDQEYELRAVNGSSINASFVNKNPNSKRLLVNGKVKSLRWKRDSTLRYNIDYNSFKTPERGQVVKNEMAKAAKVWNYIVPQIKWTETSERDRSLFVVRSTLIGVENKKVTFTAKAFFPGATRCRYLLISESWFTNYANYKTNKPTTLIHELGHVLGFRHTDAVRIDNEEDNDVFYIGKDDPLSVMGYNVGRFVTKQDVMDGKSYYSMASGTKDGHTIKIVTPDQVYINYRKTRCPLFQACRTENTPKC